ncbi:MAG: NUDIX hydrolase [Candidatus Taylorbacteria bacterium]
MNNQKTIIQKVVVGGVLILDGKVLIVQRHDNEMIYPGMWELPSGKKEALEPTERALIREFFEETGMSVKIVIPVSVFDYQTEKQMEIRDSVQINFLVEPVTDRQDVKLSDEHQKYAWVTARDLGQYNLSEASLIVINKAFDLKKEFLS